MKVILADADPAARAGWKAALADVGAGVAEAPDLPTLLQAVADGAEDALLVVAWGFARLNASALVGAIRQRRRGPPPPILAVGGEGDRAAMEAAGFAGVLIKPVPPEQLARKASLLLHGEETESRRVIREIVSTAEAEMELPFFVRLPSAVMVEFLKLAVNGKYEKGETLIRAGKSVKALHVLTLGEAEIQDGASAPRVLEMGECFGEGSFLTNEPNTATVVTRGRVEVHSLDRAGLAELVRRQPEMTKHVSALVARRKRIAGASSSGIGGNLDLMPFPELIQMLHSTRKSGVLTIGDGARTALIVFEDGEVTHASGEDLSGVEAFHRIAAWKTGLFQFASAGRGSHPVTVRCGTLALLMEAMRRVDEGSRE
jgi:CRP-like cAMP-binding protein